MKKFGALVLTAAMAFALVACGSDEAVESTTEVSVEETVESSDEASVEESTEESVEESTEEAENTGVMSYADYAAAELDSEVVIEAYVQATQSWWDGKITAYLQDQDGGYFAYNMACTEEDAAKLVPGTKIRVTGYKTEWSGEVEIAEGATFEFVEGADTYVAEAVDATDLLGTDDLANLQNQKVSFKDMTVSAVSYKNNEPGDDIYVNFTKDDAEYAFCLEYYLNGSDEEFYNMVGSLEVGQVVDVEGFLYWYEGPNPHITAVTVK